MDKKNINGTWDGTWTAEQLMYNCEHLVSWLHSPGCEVCFFGEAITDFFIAFCDEGGIDTKYKDYNDTSDARQEMCYKYIQEASNYFDFGSQKLINKLNHIIHTSDGEKAELAQSLLNSLTKFANTEKQTRIREKLIAAYKELGEKIPK